MSLPGPTDNFSDRKRKDRVQLFQVWAGAAEAVGAGFL